MYLIYKTANNISGDKMEIVYVTVLAAGSFLTLFILDKLMGHRQISQMSFFDYVVGITIGSIAAEMATNLDKSWYYGVIAMSVYAAIEILLSFLSRKSTKARKLLNGSPIILISNGKISKSALKKAKININDLITQARNQGYFDIGEIDYAVMEDNGSISFLPFPIYRSATPQDINKNPARSGLVINLVVDGKLQNDAIDYSGLTEKEVERILEDAKTPLSDILLLTIDENKKTQIFKKTSPLEN